MDKVRIGVLSHAHGHSNTYCRKMLEFDDVELVACWDENEERGREGPRTPSVWNTEQSPMQSLTTPISTP